MQIFWSAVALAAGTLIGFAFGTIQNLALRRHEKLQDSGSLNTGWALMPGSMRRVAFLILALILVQIFCPLLFVHGSRWWVSAGVALGYGTLLTQRLRRR